MSKYKIIISNLTYKKISIYLKDLAMGDTAGSYLNKSLKGIYISQVSIEEFIELIVNTKKPTCFAESDICGDSSDWNHTELSILGDICVSVPVTVYDNGLHYNPKVHGTPFNATLLYVPGALLENGKGFIPADWKEVTINNDLDFNAYYSLYERRLLPLFIYANDVAKSRSRKAFITIPGIGCGEFAGKFVKSLWFSFGAVLINIMSKYSEHFQNIKVVYYDPYQGYHNTRIEFNEILFMCKPLTNGNHNKPQLCKPIDYEEEGDNFSDCDLFSMVAWDPVSWPGNDFYIGSRTTDDGVKAAATNSMSVISGIEGFYNTLRKLYYPPHYYHNWKEVILKHKIQLCVKNNLIINKLDI